MTKKELWDKLVENCDLSDFIEDVMVKCHCCDKEKETNDDAIYICYDKEYLISDGEWQTVFFICKECFLGKKND